MISPSYLSASVVPLPVTRRNITYIKGRVQTPHLYAGLPAHLHRIVYKQQLCLAKGQ